MSSSIDDGGPAFPIPERWDGMSLRDVFACAALQGQLANQRARLEGVAEAAHLFADDSYKLADAMLEARKGGVV